METRKIPSRSAQEAFHTGDRVKCLGHTYPQWTGCLGTVKHVMQDSDSMFVIIEGQHLLLDKNDFKKNE
jgi:hypothetical protein